MKFIFDKITDFFNFLLKLSTGGTKESSKRAMSLHSGILLTSYIVIFYTTKDNAVMMAGVITGFVLALAGVTTYENVKSKNQDDENKL